MDLNLKVISVLRENYTFFNECRKNGNKLMATKTLKEITGMGLKESKEVMDIFFDKGNNILIYDRQKKLEELSKIPLINNIIEKIKNISEEELNIIFSKCDIDYLLDIDSKLEGKN